MLPQRKEDCAYSSYTTHKHTKKNSFYELELTYFSRHLCFHILCVSIYMRKKKQTPVTTFQELCRKVKRRHRSPFRLLSVYILTPSPCYLTGPLCSSSLVVWDCLIFISCVFKTSWILSRVLLFWSRAATRGPPWRVDLLKQTHHQLRVVYFHILRYFSGLGRCLRRRKDACQTSSLFCFSPRLWTNTDRSRF